MPVYLADQPATHSDPLLVSGRLSKWHANITVRDGGFRLRSHGPAVWAVNESHARAIIKRIWPAAEIDYLWPASDDAPPYALDLLKARNGR